MRFIIILLLVVGCSDFDQEQQYQIDQQANKYVESFLQISSLNRENLILKIDGSQSVVDGWNPGAFKIIGLQRYVFIDKITFDSSSDYEKEILIYHELGHALLGRQHDDRRLGIMNTYLIDEDYYVLNRSKLIADLLKQ